MTDKGIVKSFQLDENRTISIETGRLAKQADGSAVVRLGNTMILATVVARKEAADHVDFMPLTVEYKEKYAPDALAALAASSALAVSNIPFNGPISEVRVAKINGGFIVNPSIQELSQATLDMIVAATIDNIMMVEGEMKEVSEQEMLEAIKVAHEAIKVQCKVQLELAEQVEGATSKREYDHENTDEELKEKLITETGDKVYEIAREVSNIKHERGEKFEALKEAFIENIPEEEQEEKLPLVKKYFHDLHKDVVRKMVLNEKIRLDGRQLDEIRNIWCEVDYLPAAHGSAIFTRGETQSLVSTTLGTKLDEQVIDGAVIEGKSDFILHYNFPGFSTGEVKPIRGTSRREIGHGNLAMRALKQVIPGDQDNPYTIRIVSDILESNGSSSMASVCGGTLALMDAGVKITKPVSGIAMGLISDSETGKYAILSDILGDEDHLGDMDFKVTGTRDGITACQMDIKIDGLAYEILEEALDQAKKGRLHILDIMEKTIAEPRADYKPHVPRIEKMIVNKEFIGAIIGPSGKVIQEIQAQTNTTIVIEEEGEYGIVDIVSSDKESIEAAKLWIQQIVAVPEVGEIYEGKVKNITPFGAFIEILPGKDGLLHISEIEWRRLNTVEEVLKEGEQVKVKLIGVDSKTGKLKLSRKVLLPKPAKDND